MIVGTDRTQKQANPLSSHRLQDRVPALRRRFRLYRDWAGQRPRAVDFSRLQGLSMCSVVNQGQGSESKHGFNFQGDGSSLDKYTDIRYSSIR